MFVQGKIGLYKETKDKSKTGYSGEKIFFSAFEGFKTFTLVALYN